MDNKTKEIFDNCTTNYNDLVKRKQVDKVIGRDKELKRMEQILSRRKKNNIIIVAEGGVGKTTLLYGLAEKIINNNCSSFLSKKEIIEIDLSGLVANSKYRGEFENKLKLIVNEVKKRGNVILFIDEIHTLVGSGSVGNDNMDGANILKPYLSDGSLKVIGATTYKEYNKTIAKDNALERRFQKFIISEPTKSETVEILEKIKNLYEEHHTVSYSKEIVETIVNLTDRYITGRYQPDKSIDVLDEVGSRVAIEKSYKKPEELQKLEEKLEFVKDEKEKYLFKQDYISATKLFDEEKELNIKIKKFKDNPKPLSKREKTVITENDVHEVISTISGIPKENLGKQDNAHSEMKLMEDYLKRKVIGQDDAIKNIIKTIQKTKLGLKKDDKPASLFFLGQSGSGKTLLAKELTKYLFGDSKHLVRINMNEYSDKHSVSRLIGAPPGYVGHGEGGQLTRIVKDRPYSVILLDEIEKAHPDVMDIFIQVLDEGFLNDAEGQTFNFKNTIIILTSNIGTKKLKEFGGGIGYNTPTNDGNKVNKNLLIKEVEKALKPEIFNRLGKVVVFNELSKENLYNILDNYINDFKGRLETISYKLEVKDEVKDYVISKGTNGVYGARLIERMYNQYIEDIVSDELLNNLPSGSTLIVELVDGEPKVTVKMKRTVSATKKKIID